MINIVVELNHKWGGNISNIYVDSNSNNSNSNNPEIWSSLKREFGENYNAQYVSDQLIWARKNKLNIENYMKIIPTPFNTKGAEMLQHTKSLFEDPVFSFP